MHNADIYVVQRQNSDMALYGEKVLGCHGVETKAEGEAETPISWTNEDKSTVR